MITYQELIIEAVAPQQGYSGIKRSELGQGYGGQLGYVVGSIGTGLTGALPLVPVGAALGGYLGGKIGKNIINNPNDSIDEKSRLHRYGVMVAPHVSGPASVVNAIIPGFGDVGANIYNAVEGNAAKLGYGTTGKVFSMLTPFAGFTTPKAQK